METTFAVLSVGLVGVTLLAAVTIIMIVDAIQG